KFDGAPALETHRAATQVDEYIEHFPADNAHQFALRFFDLIMQTAQHATLRKGMVVLNELVRNANVAECLLVVTLQKEPTVVGEYFRLDNQSSGKRSFENIHKRNSEDLFFKHLQQVSAVAVVFHGNGRAFNLI